MLDENPALLEKTLINCLDTVAEEQDILVFIADGAVMEEAFKAMDRPSRAHRITADVAEQIKVKVSRPLYTQTFFSDQLKGETHDIFNLVYKTT